VNGFKHEGCEQDCKEGCSNDNDAAAFENDEPMLVTTVVNL